MQMPNINFYDIESLENLFTLANYKTKTNSLELFYLCDNPAIIDAIPPDQFVDMAKQKIYKENQYFSGEITLIDLANPHNVRYLASEFGLSDAHKINDPTSHSSYGPNNRLVCDTDPDYDPDIHPYLMGYNSYNYDTTMLALYLYEAVTVSVQTGQDGRPVYVRTAVSPTAARMRQHNDMLFTPMFKKQMSDYLRQPVDANGRSPRRPDYQNPPARIRKNMIMTGRHLDIARLNEKQQRVGLKRLLGMLGRQIKESSLLRPGQSHIENLDQLLDLFAYNASDVLNLPFLFQDKTYSGQFILKSQLLKTYPELIYEKKPDAYAPNISQQSVRNDRLCIDSSSSQFATKALCPYGHLTDIPVVSFMYPSEEKAREMGVPRVNVLEEIKKFFYAKFPQPELRARFDQIYEYYKSIEGKNFNESRNYQEDYPDIGNPATLAYAHSLVPPDRIVDLHPQSLSSVPDIDACMPYFNKDGSPSSCFVTFSTGGIHGAEYNKELFDADYAAYLDTVRLYEQVKAQYPDPADLKAAKKIQIDGTEYKASYFLRPAKKGEPVFYKDPTEKKPYLFKDNKLNKKYVFTSAGISNHEDFESYYPILLCNMQAFHNPGLGYDRYFEIFGQKSLFGKKMKDKSLSEDEQDLYAVQREGTKLVLNSASGSGDAKFETNIRMNNQIISMRCIGQMFSWRIGQAQTYEGARIISTNTDGLFTIMEESANNATLAAESKDINVKITPELTFLITKDSNNRIEMDHEHGYAGEIQRASGGTLACCDGPNMTKSLSHPAAIDYALAEYLITAAWNHRGMDLSQPFDENFGRIIFDQMPARMPPQKLLLMFQNIVASSTSTDRYAFYTTPDNPKAPVPMQHYNRVFIVKDGTPGAVHLHIACLSKLTPVVIAKRNRENIRAQIHDDMARQVLEINGIDMKNVPATHEAAVVKVTNLDDEWFVLIDNRDITGLTDTECQTLLSMLDYDKYLTLLRDGYENNWRNHMPEPPASENTDNNPQTDSGLPWDANPPVAQPAVPGTPDPAWELLQKQLSDAISTVSQITGNPDAKKIKARLERTLQAIDKL